eukprot:Pgem_evm2s8547
MSGISVDYTPIELKLAQKGVVGEASGIVNTDVMLNIGRGRFTKTKPIVMELHNDEYKIIMSYSDMESLGMTISGLPNPTALDNDSAYFDDQLLSDPEYKMDTKDYTNVKTACLEELKANYNNNIKINDWCSLENAEVTFEINKEKLKSVNRK